MVDVLPRGLKFIRVLVERNIVWNVLRKYVCILQARYEYSLRAMFCAVNSNRPRTAMRGDC